MAKAIDNIAELLTEELKGFLLEARVGTTSHGDVDVDARVSQYRMRFLGLVVRPNFRHLRSLAHNPFLCRANYRPCNHRSPTQNSNPHCEDLGPERNTKP
jgi:hypothetical protein